MGFTYDVGIEQLLRHDPDIICIGETRNSYTAKMVLRASLTGHLVLTRFIKCMYRHHFTTLIFKWRQESVCI